MQTDNLELKKLVYLYLMNYAKSQPDMAIMAVNSFVKVTCSRGLSENSPAQQLSLCLLCPLAFVNCRLSLLLYLSLWTGGACRGAENKELMCWIQRSGSSLLLVIAEEMT